MKEEAFIIDYKIFHTDGTSNHPPKMRVRHCMGELHAKIKLEGYMKKKYPLFRRLEVLSCMNDNPLSNLFDMFGSNNPFK